MDAPLSYKGLPFAFLLFRKPRFMSVGRSERQVGDIRPLLKGNLRAFSSRVASCRCTHEDSQCWPMAVSFEFFISSLSSPVRILLEPLLKIWEEIHRRLEIEKENQNTSRS